jgi:hypothetical protein
MIFMKNILLTAILAAAGFIGVSIGAIAQPEPPPPNVIYVQSAPPQPMTETVPVVPGPGYVWVAGYYQWTGDDYVWVPGHYVEHPGAWCAGQWRHDPERGWYYVLGHWC